MPKAPSPARAEAKALYLASNGKEKLRIIAEKLSVPEKTISGWKAKDKWDEGLNGVLRKNTPKNKRSTPKKRGAPKGNKNAVGNVGGTGAAKGKANPSYQHGAYTDVYWDMLDENERALLEEGHDEAEQLLIEQIQLYSIRERRLMTAITKLRDQKGQFSMSGLQRFENKREFSDDAEKQMYDELVLQKKSEDKISYIGHSYQLTTVTEANINVIQRLESELTKVQRAKTSCIDTLARIRAQKETDATEVEDTSETDGQIYG